MKTTFFLILIFLFSWMILKDKQVEVVEKKELVVDNSNIESQYYEFNCWEDEIEKQQEELEKIIDSIK